MPMLHLVDRLIEIAWVAFLLFWFISAFFVSRVVKRQNPSGRVLTLVLGAIPFILLFGSGFQWGPLGRRFIPETLLVALAGDALAYAGLGLALWARIILGRNWSAAVTIKEDHRLIRTGPYSVVRHPIYSGLLLALLGSALDIGEVRALLAVAIAFVIWFFKSRTEERFMVEQFGQEYEDYRRRTRALVPFIF
jgi:protein-S-isoprenylcysteine O-methyltransferase Ste14